MGRVSLGIEVSSIRQISAAQNIRETLNIEMFIIRGVEKKQDVNDDNNNNK